MSTLSETKIAEIVAQNPGVPVDVVRPAVDPNSGFVDHQLLGHLLTAFNVGAGEKVVRKSAAQEELRQQLQKEYEAAKLRGDAVAIVSLTRRIHEASANV